MTKLSDFLLRFRRRRAPLIPTAWGQVTESARRQAAVNMRHDLALRERVIALLAAEGRPRAVAEQVARERYPEAWE